MGCNDWLWERLTEEGLKELYSSRSVFLMKQSLNLISPHYDPNIMTSLTGIKIIVKSWAWNIVIRYYEGSGRLQSKRGKVSLQNHWPKQGICCWNVVAKLGKHLSLAQHTYQRIARGQTASQLAAGGEVRRRYCVCVCELISFLHENSPLETVEADVR